MKYQNRIHWHRHRPEFLKVGFIFSLAIIFMAFNYTSHAPVYEPFEIEELDGELEIIPPATTHEKKKVLPPPPPEKINVVEVEPTTEPDIKFVEKVEFKEEVKEAIKDEFASEPVEEKAPVVELVKEEPEEEVALIFAERMPVYGGCDVDEDEDVRRDCTSKNLIKHTYEHVHYPALAREYETQGTVVVSFIVNKQGYVEDVKIVKDIGMGCGDEVIKAIKKLGRFLPGKQNGKPVAVIYRLPVKFSLE